MIHPAIPDPPMTSAMSENASSAKATSQHAHRLESLTLSKAPRREAPIDTNSKFGSLGIPRSSAESPTGYHQYHSCSVRESTPQTGTPPKLASHTMKEILTVTLILRNGGLENNFTRTVRPRQRCWQRALSNASDLFHMGDCLVGHLFHSYSRSILPTGS
jgi:hypothetical protein